MLHVILFTLNDFELLFGFFHIVPLAISQFITQNFLTGSFGQTVDKFNLETKSRGIYNISILQKLKEKLGFSTMKVHNIGRALLSEVVFKIN